LSIRGSWILVCVAALASSGCGDPKYLLEIEQTESPEASSAPRVAILDSKAAVKIEEIHLLYTQAADSLDRQFADSKASLDAELETKSKPVKDAERRLRIARNLYTTAFRAMLTFQSFGGNAIFDRSDERVMTEDLLEEISDRFYKGKAFSLETGARIRSKIRESLIPAEKRVINARNAVTRAKRAQRRVADLREKVAGELSGAKQQLLNQFNGRVIDRLAGAIIRDAGPDSSGFYRFDLVTTGRFHIYVPGSNPILVEIVVDGHRRIQLRGDAPSPLISPSDA